jgi:hypothetical protein
MVATKLVFEVHYDQFTNHPSRPSTIFLRVGTSGRKHIRKGPGSSYDVKELDLWCRLPFWLDRRVMPGILMNAARRRSVN